MAAVEKKEAVQIMLYLERECETGTKMTSLQYQEHRKASKLWDRRRKETGTTTCLVQYYLL